ncbi:pentatricopeptide repeat-containing protein At1g73400, mitochondrial-like [Zingiber officinale]|uniref:pentatricopeptide repeat-containing protein At1g73400, mitochondrial-like n=1 Tax=Zingiber officinale TaxID=94328 RepID=UPI001C4D6A16|nr:pentatricopeptide repeat-containing protein At1g73400, mitochondrial-like [Zingiber officinale]
MRSYPLFPALIRRWSVGQRSNSSNCISIARYFSSYSRNHHYRHRCFNGQAIWAYSKLRVISDLHNAIFPPRTASDVPSFFNPLFYSSSSDLPVHPYSSSSELPAADEYSSGSVNDGGKGGDFGPASNKIYEAIMSSSGSSGKLEDALDSLAIVLTTGLVDDVLQMLRYEEKLAFRFFTWAGHQDGYTHVPSTFNFMIDVLSNTRYKSKQFGVVCDILDHMKRSSKKSVPVNALVTILQTYTENHLTHIKKFAKKRRIRMKTPPATDAFNLLLDALCKCYLVKEADTMFHRLKNKVTPNAGTYNIMFFGWCRVRNPKQAIKLLEEMIQMGHKPENFTYNAAIDSFCSAGMISEAEELFEFMRTEGSTISSPTAKTYSIMIVAFAKFDKMDACFTLLSDMKTRGCLPDVSTYKEIIEGMCLAGNIEAAYKVLLEMAETGFRPDILTYNCFLKVLCDLKKDEEALLLCDKMIEAGCEPSIHTYNMLMKMYFEMGEPDRAIDMWQEMNRRRCTYAADTYCIMIDGLFNCDRAEGACCLLDEIIERRIKLSYSGFDAILLRLSEIGNLSAIHRLSEHMRTFYNVAMARRFAVREKKKRISLRRI